MSYGRPIDESQVAISLVYSDKMVPILLAPDEHIDHVRKLLTVFYDTGLPLDLKYGNSFQIISIMSVISLDLGALKSRQE